MLSEFISLIRSQIARAIYVWGGQGQDVTSEAQIIGMETSTGNAFRAIALWNKRKAAGVDPVKMFDCSGLIIWALQTLKLIDHDMTADGLYHKSAKISAPQIGDFAFMVDRSGKAYHVGIVTRQGYVTEAKGRDDGVVERPIGTAWKAYGQNPFINTSVQEVSDTIYVKYGDGQETNISSNPAVMSMQQGLVRLGYKMINAGKTYPPDGRYGTATANGVSAFKLDNKLPGDGQTVDSGCLTVILARLIPVPTADATELNAIKTQLAAKSAQITSLTAEAVAAKAAQLAAEQAASLARSELTALNDRVEKIRAGRDALAGL